MFIKEYFIEDYYIEELRKIIEFGRDNYTKYKIKSFVIVKLMKQLI